MVEIPYNMVYKISWHKYVGYGTTDFMFVITYAIRIQYKHCIMVETI